MSLLKVQSLRGKERLKFLVENEKDLKAEKKSLIKKCDPVSCAPSTFEYVAEGNGFTKKAIINGKIPPDAEVFNAVVVANTSMWCDSHMDVLLKNSAKKSIQQRGRAGLIPFIHDHIYELTARIATVNRIFYQDVELRKLGVKQDGTAQCLMFDGDIRRELNEEVFNLYRKGYVNQHSIGLRYIDLMLAINEPDDEFYEPYYKVWKKYIDDIINKDYVVEQGYFWAVPEYELLENSGVLLGSNVLTPIYSIGDPDTEDDEAKGEGATTSKSPEQGTLVVPDTNTLNYAELVKGMKFFN